MNRIHNCKNPNQGDYKKVLCVCSAGLLRSPTAAMVLAKAPFNFNTRAAGIESYALVLVDEVLLNWAEMIVCMDKTQKREIDRMLAEFKIFKLSDKVINLDIPDRYEYRSKALIRIIAKKCKEIFFKGTEWMY